MKKILLIGDSIRMGYDSFVRAELKNEAEVFFSEDNARYAQYTLRQLHEWKSELNLDAVDIIHWNVGLWDVVHLGCGMDREAEGLTPDKITNGAKIVYEKDPLTPLPMYEYMLERIVRRLENLFPRAKIIFALTTNVQGNVCPDWGCRSDAEVVCYNEAAKRVMKKCGVAVNDLYSFTKENCRTLHADWVHYTDEGSTLIAREIADFIRPLL